jgi:hypothetical protein
MPLAYSVIYRWLLVAWILLSGLKYIVCLVIQALNFIKSYALLSTRFNTPSSEMDAALTELVLSEVRWLSEEPSFKMYDLHEKLMEFFY